MGHATDIKSFIGEFLRLPGDRISDTATLGDLVADSFQAVELLVALQDEFGFLLSHDDMAQVETLGGLLELIEIRIST